MADIEGMDADVFFGEVDEPLLDWRDHPIDPDVDPDDDELAETPADVIAILGFDPKDI